MKKFHYKDRIKISTPHLSSESREVYVHVCACGCLSKAITIQCKVQTESISDSTTETVPDQRLFTVFFRPEMCEEHS